MGEGTVLVLGLGNPGPGYSQTRHNAGVWALDALSRELGVALKPRSTLRAWVAEAAIGGRRVVLGFPQTFMNDSGRALLPLAKKFAVSLPDGLVVIHDELDLPEGAVRVKHGGGLAGHNGLRSIHASIGTNDFSRVRVGISRPSASSQVHDWVLSRPRAEGRRLIDEALPTAVEAVELIVSEGVDVAMNRINGSNGAK